MEAARPLPQDSAKTTTAAPRASFWTSAPGLLGGIATLIGSVVALTTVLVQAGVIESSATTTQAGLAQTAASRAKSAFRAGYAGQLPSSGLPSSIPDY